MRLCIGAVRNCSYRLRLKQQDIGIFGKDYIKFSGEVSLYEAEVNNWERECWEKKFER